MINEINNIRWKNILACDVDGTLIRNADDSLDPSIFKTIKKLHSKGYLFVPVSGRDYSGIKRLFLPVHDLIYYICVNGAQIFRNDEILFENSMSKSLVKAVLEDVENKGFTYFVSGRNTTFILESNREFVEIVKDYSSSIKIIKTLNDIDETILRISAYSENSAKRSVPVFEEKWASECHLVVSGPSWIDFTIADKGLGLNKLCNMLNIPLTNTWAFGDQYNDLPMLDMVEHPYIMSFATPELHKPGYRIIDSVEPVLLEILEK